MRVNIYAEEMTKRIEIVQKSIDVPQFTGPRFYLELPVTTSDGRLIRGPFMHGKGDDDSSAVTFYLRAVLRKALAELDAFYEGR